MNVPAVQIEDRAVRCYAFAEAKVRGINKAERKVQYVAATETPVPTWLGPEVLRMSGMEARPYVPFLRAHVQDDPEFVLGSLTWELVGRELHIEVTYDEDEASDRIFRKVVGGSIRAVSVGWLTHEVRVLGEDEVDGEGEAKVAGPARVITKWTLIEVSQVGLGADPNALRRSALEGTKMNYPQPAEPATTPTQPTTAQSAQPVASPQASPAPQARAQETDAQVRLTRRVRALAGDRPEMRAFADQILLEHADLDETKARALLLKKHRSLLPPVGTPSQPEAPPVAPAGQASAGATGGEKRTISADQAARALKALRS